MSVKRINRNSVFFPLFAISASNLLLQLMGFVYRVFLSRLIGAEGVGVYSLIMPFYSVITSVTLTGLLVAVARISAERSARGDMSGARKCVSRSQVIFVIMTAVVSVFTFCFRDFIAETLLGDERCAPSLVIILFCLFLTGFENIFKNYFYGVGRVAPQITSELSEQAVRFLAVMGLLLVFRPQNPAESSSLIVLGMVASELVSSSILFFFFSPERRKRTTLPLPPPNFSEIFSVALPVSLAATLNNIISAANSVLIPRRLVASGMGVKAATESFGVMFGMTIPLLSFPIAFIASLSSVMVPKISEKLARGDFSEMRRKAGKTIHATGLLAMPCTALLVPFGSELAQNIFKHADAGAFMLPLAVAVLLSYYQITTGALLNGMGMQKKSALYIVISGIIEFMFTWSVGIPSVGMGGFVAGFIVSGAVGFILNFNAIVKRLSLRIRFTNWFVNPLLASVFSALTANIFFDFISAHIASRPILLILSFSFGFAVYALTLYALGTDIVRYIRSLIPQTNP